MSNYSPTGLLPTPMTGFGGEGSGTSSGFSGGGSAYANGGGAVDLNSGNASGMEETANQHFVIGDNLRNKAFYDDAIDEFQKAIHIQEQLLGDNSPVAAQTHYALGLCFRATKNFKAALFHLTKAAGVFEKQPLEEGEEKKRPAQQPYRKEIVNCKLNIARTHHSQGVELQRAGDYDKSITEHRKALSIREHLLGRSHLETARTYYVIGCALSDRGSFDEALAELRRALRTRLLIFGPQHSDTKEVIGNLGVILSAKGNLSEEEVAGYMVEVLESLNLERQGDQLCRKGEYANGMVCYRKALGIEELALGVLHPTTCDLYLRMADALGQLGDLESSLIEYKSAISIYERVMGKFHVKVADIYNKLAGILMDKGEYETALSFYAKAYGIYDAELGNHDDTRQAMMNIRLSAAKERSAKESMDLIKKAEEDFKHHQEERRLQEERILKEEAELMEGIAKMQVVPKQNEKPAPPPPKPVEQEDII